MKITCDFGDDRCRIASARLEMEFFCEDSFAYGSYKSIDACLPAAIQVFLRGGHVKSSPLSNMYK